MKLIELLAKIKANEANINKRLNEVAVEPEDVEMLNLSRDNLRLLTEAIQRVTKADELH
ncbi:hypothetical protein M4B38_25735 [Klebsiella pneumoniae]|nr:hypothetical protein [Klebsiella pneumoniae]MCM6213553.1 hypothetical protein [Klebsiella pneumoniae]